jgi:hypothetical protein
MTWLSRTCSAGDRDLRRHNGSFWHEPSRLAWGRGDSLRLSPRPFLPPDLAVEDDTNNLVVLERCLEVHPDYVVTDEDGHRTESYGHQQRDPAQTPVIEPL